MIVVRKNDLLFVSLFAVLFFILLTVFIKQGTNLSEAMANSNQITIVVDAGHGEPDGGAVASDGTKESYLNLQIAEKVEELLIENGFLVVMTRNDEHNIADADKQSKIKETKVSDLNNRVEIANSSNADFLISIHMNKFSDSKYNGWQTFYSKTSPTGKILAENIQTEIKTSTNRENKRTPLTISGIKIVDKSTIPTVIVECGFLSNHEETELLKSDDYQYQIAEGIVNGIKKTVVQKDRA